MKCPNNGTVEKESINFWGNESGRVMDSNGDIVTWNEH